MPVAYLHAEPGLVQNLEAVQMSCHPLSVSEQGSFHHAEGYGLASVGDTVFSNSLASAALFVLHRDPSALILQVTRLMVQADVIERL